MNMTDDERAMLTRRVKILRDTAAAMLAEARELEKRAKGECEAGKSGCAQRYYDGTSR
jgi:hypothetical protein